MNRRPMKSRSGYDSFSPRDTARIRVHTPDAYFFERKKRTPLWRRLLRLLLLLLALVFVINLIANQFVFIKRVTVPVRGLDEAFDGFTILHISDLKGARFGPEQLFFSLALSDEKADLIVMTGDMVSPMGNAQPFFELLAALREKDAKTPIYYIAGDGDPLPASMNYAASGSPFASWVLGARPYGAQLLSSPVSIERAGQRIWLATSSQLSLDIDTMQGQYELQYLAALDRGDENEIELTAYQLSSLEAIRTARKEMTAGDIYIALTHTLPSGEDGGALSPASLPRAVDLMLGGHYLGGLIRLPLLGPLFIPSSGLPLYGILPGEGTYSGLTRKASTWLYTSPGLGSKDPLYPEWFFRFMNPPTVTLLTLTPSAL